MNDPEGKPESVPDPTEDETGEPVPNQFEAKIYHSGFAPNIGRVQYAVGKVETATGPMGTGFCCTVNEAVAEAGAYESFR